MLQERSLWGTHLEVDLPMTKYKASMGRAKLPATRRGTAARPIKWHIRAPAPPHCIASPTFAHGCIPHGSAEKLLRPHLSPPFISGEVIATTLFAFHSDQLDQLGIVSDFATNERVTDRWISIGEVGEFHVGASSGAACHIILNECIRY